MSNSYRPFGSNTDPIPPPIEPPKPPDDGGGGGGGGAPPPAPPPTPPPPAEGGQGFNPGFAAFGLGLTAPNPNVPRYRNTFSAREVKGRNGKGTGVIEWTLTIWDFHGGLNATWGDFYAIPNRISSSTGWTHIPGYATLPYDLIEGSALTFTNAKGVHHANIFDTTALGVGSGANSSLFTATTGDWAARTYSPPSPITALATGVIGGATAQEYLFVCMSGDPVDVLSDLASTPTDAGNMHADTDPCWGIIQVPLNDTPGQSTLLLYNQQQISKLSSISAIGTQPTAVLTNIPGGGFALGNAAPDGVHRAWWVWPKQHTAAGMLADLTSLGRIVSTNWEGSDPQILDVPLKHGITAASIWNGGIVYTDMVEDYWYRNGHHYSLARVRDREVVLPAGSIPAGAVSYITRGFIVQGKQLYAVSEKLTAGTPGARSVSFELFDERTWSWHTMSPTFSGGDALNPSMLRAGGAYPYSIPGSTAFVPIGRAARQRLPLPDSVPHLLGIADFESSAVIRSANWILPGQIGTPSVIEEIVFGGYLNSKFGFSASSSQDASVQIEQLSQGKDAPDTGLNSISATFNERDPTDARTRRFPDNTSSFTSLQLRATITRATSNATNTSPSVVPFIVRGLSFPDGKVRSPSKVRRA